MRLNSKIILILILLPILINKSGESAISKKLSCFECHDDVRIISLSHKDFECVDCHANIQEIPHQENPLKELRGKKLCSQCHEEMTINLNNSVHKEFSCKNCHGAAHAVFTQTIKACANCHNKEFTAFKESIHSDILECATCHGDSHKIIPDSELASPVSPLNQIETCGKCHESPPKLIHGFLESVHGQALVLSGLAIAPSCADCHKSHGVFPPTDKRSTVSPRNVPETCGTCHRYIVEKWIKRSAHGKRWKQDKEGPVCITCHTSHSIEEPRIGIARLKFPETCGGCHGENYSSYRDSFHGQATDLGFITAATCSDCHTPHENLSKKIHIPQFILQIFKKHAENVMEKLQLLLQLSILI